MSSLEGLGGDTISGLFEGTGIGLGFLIVKWLAEFIAKRKDKKEEQLDGATARLIAGLEQRLAEEVESRRNLQEEQRNEARQFRDELRELRAELAECNRKHADAEAEVKGLRKMVDAIGEARQHAQLIVSAEKLTEKQSKSD